MGAGLVMSGSMASLALTVYSSSSSDEPWTNWMPGSSSIWTGPCGSERSHSRFSGVSWSRVQSVASPDRNIVVERRAVDELDAGKFVDMDGTLRQRAQPFEIFRGELVARPERSESGDGVEE